MRLTRLLAATLATFLVATGAHAADDPAVQSVKTLYASFESALKGGAGPVKDRAALIGPTLDTTFDLPTMARVAVGPAWKGFTPEQQGALTEAFGRYFTATYATRLAQAIGGKFDVKPQSEVRGSNRVVQTEVANADGDASQVDFLIGPANTVQDVYLNGNVSEIASLRTSFSEPLKAGGADQLLKFMQNRTAGMLAAKPAP